MKTKLLINIMLPAIAVTAGTSGCTSAWWDVSMSPYDYYYDPIAPPPPDIYPLPSRPIFYPNGWGPGFGPGWGPGHISGGIGPVVPNNRPSQNRPPESGQRPGGNVVPENRPVIHPQVPVTILPGNTNSGGGGAQGTHRRGGNSN